MIKLFLVGLLVFSFSFGKTVIVSAAANTQFAIKDIIKKFKQKNPQINIKLIISSSGKLANQIANGAPYDVFISADTKYPQFLYNLHKTAGKPKIYAYGILVLWSIKKDLHSIYDITKPDIRKIAVANPKLAPYGRETIKVLKYYNIYSKVRYKIVFGESIAQASQYIIKGLVDAGFTAKSIVLAPSLKDKGSWIEIDQKAYDPIAQAAVLINNDKEAKAFFDFLFSQEAKKILKRYGYKVP